MKNFSLKRFLLCRSAAEEYADYPYVIVRSAEGLAKLPPSLNDIKLARKLAKKGLQNDSENIIGNMVMALINENFDKVFALRIYI